MKRTLSILLLLVFCVTFATSVFAAEPQEVIINQEIQTIDDTSYVIVTTSEIRTPSLTRGTFNISGKKDYTYILYNTVQWTFTVYGTFTVNENVSSTCIDSAYGFAASVGGWSLSYGTNSKNGSTASASGTVVGPKTVYPAASLTCNSKGELY